MTTRSIDSSSSLFSNFLESPTQASPKSVAKWGIWRGPRSLKKLELPYFLDLPGLAHGSYGSSSLWPLSVGSLAGVTWGTVRVGLVTCGREMRPIRVLQAIIRLMRSAAVGSGCPESLW